MSGAWTHVPPLLSAPPLVALLWCVAHALGRRTLTALRVPLHELTPSEKGFFSLTVGCGLLQYLPVALAAVGQLNPRSVLLGFAVLGALLTQDLLNTIRSLVRHLRVLTRQRPSPETIVWASLFVVLMGRLLVHAVVPDPFDDGDGYHMAAPKRWLQEGTLSYLPSYTTTNGSMGFEMLYSLAIATGSFSTIKLIHYTAGLFMFFGLSLSARRLGSASAGALTASLLMIYSPVLNLPFLFGVAYVDFGACWMAAGTVLAFLLWQESRRPQWLTCLALCAGFAASFKSTSLFIVVAWLPVLAWDARRHMESWVTVLRRVISVGIVAFLPVVPWLFRSWRATGNPVFPMFWTLIPTRDWNAEIASVFGRFIHYYSWGVASGANLGEPQRKAIVLGVALAVIAVVGVALVRTRRIEYRYLRAFAGAFVLISIGLGGMVFRYWLPGVVSATLVFTCWLTERPSMARWGKWLAPAFMAVALAVTSIHPPTNVFMRDLRIASGVHTLEEEYEGEPMWSMWRHINANTPKDAHILIASFYTSFGASSFGCFWVDRTCFASDSHLQIFIRLDDWDAFLQSLQKAGIEYVVISDRQFTPGRHGYSFTAGRNEYPFCRRLVDEYGEKLAQFGHMQLYRVRTSIAAGI
jgi:hypothetical protein